MDLNAILLREDHDTTCSPSMSSTDTSKREEPCKKYFGPTEKLSAAVGVSDLADVPATKRKRADTAGNTFEALEAQVARLKQQLDDAYKFIAKSGIGLGK
jgi:hypothetical protein